MRPLASLVVATCTGLCGCASSGAMAPKSPTPTDIAALEVRARRDTADAGTQLRLAEAYRGANRSREAGAVADRALARWPNDSRAALIAGLIREDLGDYTAARDLYQRALRNGSPRVRSQIQSRLALLQRRETQVYVKAALARERELTAAPPRPRTIAIFPLAVPGAADTVLGPMSRALTAMLVTDMSQTDRLTVLDRLVVQMLLDEIRLGQSGRVDPATAARGGRLLGAERLIQGTLAADEEQLRLELAVVSLARGTPTPAAAAPPAVDTAKQPARGAKPTRPQTRPDTRRPTQRAPVAKAPVARAPADEEKAAPAAPRTTSVAEADRLDRLFDLEKRLALRLYTTLGIELSPAERASVTKRRTENLQALLAYGRGLQASDAGNFQAALQFYNQATRIDPGFAAAREQAAAARALVTASAVSSAQLAATALARDVIGTNLVTAEAALTALQRDALAEVLGTEGATARTVIELVIQRPGGAQ